MKKIISVIIVIVILFAGGFFYFWNQVYYSQGSFSGQKIFEITKGEGNAMIAGRLKSESLISGQLYFYYYLRSHGLLNKIMPGDYQLSGHLTIPEIARIITNPEEKFLRLTFPEGWDARKMAAELKENGLDGDKFLGIVNNPGDFKKRYSYLSGEKVTTLEGYLFPDTYFFKKDIKIENIVGRMLDTFDQKLDDRMRKDIASQKRTIGDIVTMASIIEREVQTLEDMKIVSGIFWKRADANARLQSDATLSYILNDKTDQHSGADLEINSPYNSYLFPGLPPGPIGNPGLNALLAAIYPQNSEYNYFLTATVNGEKKVIYSKTFEEHVANKAKYGL
jgi:UPF0755 protein